MNRHVSGTILLSLVVYCLYIEVSSAKKNGPVIGFDNDTSIRMGSNKKILVKFSWNEWN